MVFMALRMNQGLSREAFAQRFGKRAEDVFSAALQRCKAQNWLTETADRIMLTEEGRVLGNLVFLEFME